LENNLSEMWLKKISTKGTEQRFKRENLLEVKRMRIYII